MPHLGIKSRDTSYPDGGEMAAREVLALVVRGDRIVDTAGAGAARTPQTPPHTRPPTFHPLQLDHFVRSYIATVNIFYLGTTIDHIAYGQTTSHQLQAQCLAQQPQTGLPFRCHVPNHPRQGPSQRY